ncbi:MAG: outer membrane beta-barrel protein [Gemmatimonadaceae bacterium]|nr:outer membrane beta-barrel protein [Gemmatimonadaceae bacterium]
MSAAGPAKASADWLFTPFIGSNFGGTATINESGTDFEDEFERRVNFGASLAWMGAGIAGFEVDFGYAPNFFEETKGDSNFGFGESNVTTLMGNVVVGAPIGGTSGVSFRPYAVGGVGIIKTQVGGPDDLFDVSKNNFGFNAGGGVTGFFTDNVGIRGDLRYFRSLQDNEPDGDVDIAVSDFKFWRGSVGVTFRF